MIEAITGWRWLRRRADGGRSPLGSYTQQVCFSFLSARNARLIGRIACFIVMSLGKRSDYGPFRGCSGPIHASPQPLLDGGLASRQLWGVRTSLCSLPVSKTRNGNHRQIWSRGFISAFDLEAKGNAGQRAPASPRLVCELQLPAWSGWAWVVPFKTAVAPYDDPLKKLKRSEDGLQHEQKSASWDPDLAY